MTIQRGYSFKHFGDRALEQEAIWAERDGDDARLAAVKAEQERRTALQVWVVTSVWSPNDDSDSFGEYPLSTLALFRDEDDAVQFATLELANHDLSREKDSEEFPDDEDDDDVAPLALKRNDEGVWEVEVNNDYENIWIEVRRLGVR